VIKSTPAWSRWQVLTRMHNKQILADLQPCDPEPDEIRSESRSEALGKSCTSRALPSWWPVWRWSLAYKNPMYLPAITAQASLRLKAMEKTISQEGLRWKKKMILQAVCARRNLDSGSFDWFDPKLQADITQTVNEELQSFVEKGTHSEKYSRRFKDYHYI
jgi:hypothetical protein